ncbi:glycosyltransferase [Salmonirosea aquatica]|uniref:Glycosyltransferase n=1 Tax=Salmonirosea aquatica TaxID=2654236 RepID=A0A7C9FXU4_9BACT|nr:glycosyltransferase [Cytophagaceae bacterium SJW1-29]
MNILHVVYSLVPHRYKGGIPKAVYELARAQAQLGHQSVVYTTNYNSDEKFILTEENRSLTSEGVEIHYFDAYKAGVLFSPELFKALRYNGSQFDVIHAHNVFHPLNQYASRVGKRCGLPVFFHIHGSLDPGVVQKGLLKSLKKKLYLFLFEIPTLRKSAGIFAISQDEADLIRQLIENVPVHYLPNGIHLPAFHKKEEKTFIRIVFIGRIHPKKGLHYLLAALREVAAVVPEVHLYIGGDRKQNPGYVGQLDMLIEEYKLSKKITWLGFLDEAQKYARLAEADIFCHLSHSEGLTLAIMESMGSGVATLIGKGWNVDQAVRMEALVTCDPTQPQEVASILLGLIRNRLARLALGQNARKYVAQYHDWTRIAQTCVDVYQRILSR